MHVLKTLVDALSVYVKDAIAVPEADIRQFAQDANVHLRDDHVRFLMKFGCAPGGRLNIFLRYGGDFGFETVSRVCTEQHPDMEPPQDATYFGSDFVGSSFAIDHHTGHILTYDPGIRYGMVHGSIDGFLLSCLLPVHGHEAFPNKLVRRDLGKAFIRDFMEMHAQNRMVEATRFELDYELADTPARMAEYYVIDRQLIALHPEADSMVIYSGGILNKAAFK